ncbi:hypothetical protein DAT35_55555 [Vitiosangium sp. GDMCC 1.1324]|nr:hypothetical protein DAT35_55555 [Vitiosangium sp. GDMCC 1.1324]
MLAGLVAVPVYVVPVGLWGVRALWPRVLRDATSGAIALGLVSLAGMGLCAFARVKTEQPGSERWKLPSRWPLMPEEFAASAASGH